MTERPGSTGPHAAARRECMNPDWLQINVALERPAGEALPSARRVFAALQPQLIEWRGSGRLRRFFFMRKPPDIRLRFQATEARAALLPSLESLLHGLREQGAVSRFFPSVYEPEAALFGGPDAMELVHAHFETDSLGWMELDRLAAGGAARMGAQPIASAVLNDLFLRTLDDGNEVWDVWRNLQKLVDVIPTPEGAEVAPDIDSLLSRGMSSADAAVLRQYAAANRGLAEGLLLLWGQGRLECGLRGLLAYVGLFLFNRHGLGGPEKSAVAAAMCSLLDPMRGLSGGSCLASGPRPR